jgi:hypothetical protein
MDCSCHVPESCSAVSEVEPLADEGDVGVADDDEQANPMRARTTKVSERK